MQTQNQKSKELLPKIIRASNNDEAIEVLHNILELLHLSESYVNIVKVRDALSERKEEFRRITDNYQNSDKSLRQMLDTRTELNFVYRNISDEFSYIVNKNKIFFEENRRSIKIDSMKDMTENTEYDGIFKSKSATALDSLLGASDIYRKHVSEASISYGLYQELANILNSIRMWIDLLASSIKTEQMIQSKDVK